MGRNPGKKKRITLSTPVSEAARLMRKRFKGRAEREASNRADRALDYQRQHFWERVMYEIERQAERDQGMR